MVSATPHTSGPIPMFDHDPDALERAPLALGCKVTSGYGGPVAAAIKQVKSDKIAAMADSDKLLHATSEDGRYHFLDVSRIICIWLVCVDHGGTPFGVWNVMYVQAWVLQYLFLICGICYGMTSKPLPGFIARLGLYFVVGVGCNFSAWLILGMDWKKDMWNVVFQFWFVVALILFVLVLAPLKVHLIKVSKRLQEGAQANGETEGEAHYTVSVYVVILVICGGFVVINLVFAHILIPILQYFLAEPLANSVKNDLGPAAVFWGLPTTKEDGRIFVSTFFTYFQLSVGNMYLVLVFPLMSAKVPLVGWLVMLNTYAHKMVLYRAQEARMINGFDFTMLGLVCYYYGLSKRRQIGELVIRYWFILLFTCAVLWPAGLEGRLDENPPTDLVERARYNMLEFVFTFMFLTGMERMYHPQAVPTFTREALSNWALLLFLVHKACHLMFPQPFNWIVLISLFVPCYLHRMSVETGQNSLPVKSAH